MRMLRRTPPAPVRPAARPARPARQTSMPSAVGQELSGIGGRVTQWVYDIRAELKKVVWPTREQAINLTALVIGVSLAVAVFIVAIDAILQRVFQLILGGA